MKDPWEQLSVWLVRTILFVAAVMLAAALIAGLWLFSRLVRFAAYAIVGRTGSETWEAPDLLAIRATGGAVGGVVGLTCSIAVLSISPTSPLVLPVGLALGALLGCLVAPEGHDPWRALPMGRFIDDWRDDSRVA